MECESRGSVEKKLDTKFFPVQVVGFNFMRIVQQIPGYGQTGSVLRIGGSVHKTGVEPKIESTVLVSPGHGPCLAVEFESDITGKDGAVQGLDPEEVLFREVLGFAIGLCLSPEVHDEGGHIRGTGHGAGQVRAVTGTHPRQGLDPDFFEGQPLGGGDPTPKFGQDLVKIVNVSALTRCLHPLIFGSNGFVRSLVTEKVQDIL